MSKFVKIVTEISDKLKRIFFSFFKIYSFSLPFFQPGQSLLIPVDRGFVCSFCGFFYSSTPLISSGLRLSEIHRRFYPIVIDNP